MTKTTRPSDPEESKETFALSIPITTPIHRLRYTIRFQNLRNSQARRHHEWKKRHPIPLRNRRTNSPGKQQAMASKRTAISVKHAALCRKEGKVKKTTGKVQSGQGPTTEHLSKKKRKRREQADPLRRAKRNRYCPDGDTRWYNDKDSASDCQQQASSDGTASTATISDDDDDDNATSSSSTASKLCLSEDDKDGASECSNDTETTPFALPPDVCLPEDLISTTTKAKLLQDLQVIRSQYEIQSLLGAGAFGCVFLAQEQRLDSSTRNVAIKWLYDTPDAALTKDKEVQFLKQFKGVSHIVQLLQVVPSNHDDRIFLVMEYCQGSNLQQELDRGVTYTEEKCCHVLRQVLEALQVLHAANVLHRDFKPENIMQNDNNTTLIDMGLCVHVAPGTAIRSKSGTEGFWAPEVYDESSQYYATGYDTSADMYSVGCTLYTLLMRGTKYNPAVREETGWDNSMSFWARDLVENLTQLNPGERLTVKETLEHPFFATKTSLLSVTKAHIRRSKHSFKTLFPYILIAAAFLLSAMLS